MLSIDVGVIKDGWVADAAMTVPIGPVDRGGEKLLDVTKASLFAGVEQMQPGNHLGDVSAAIQRAVEAEGLSIIRTLVGHGIGREMHEEPQVPNFGEPGKGPLLEEGTVLAIEPMVNVGGPLVRMGDDGWAVYSEDGSLAAHFEFTVAVTADGPRILTPWHEERSEFGAPSRGYAELCGRGAARTLGRRSLCFVHASSAAFSVCSLPLHLRYRASPSAAPQPYGTNDAGGFRNVLPPGENGLDTLSQIFSFRGLGTLPAHFADQQPLYENLVYGAPELGDEQSPAAISRTQPSACPPGEIDSTIEPRPGVTILRDSAYGVPHIYGDTRADTMFGAGYAGAADRLFLMDVLRHTGRAELASFLGGSNAERRRLASGNSPPTPRPTLKNSSTPAPAIRRRSACRPTKTSTATSTESTPTSPRPQHQPGAEAGGVLAA